MLDDLDKQIIQALQEDARMAFEKIASRVGVSARTVSTRVNRLVESGVIDLIAVVNPERIGYPVLGTIFIETELRETKQVAERLAAMEEVAFVGLTAGDPDIYASVRASSNVALATFMTEKLPSIPGVRKARMLLVLETVKSASRWQVPSRLQDDDSTTPQR